VIVGSGTESRDYQREGAQRLAQYLGTELVTLAGGGHQSHTTHPKEFAGFVRRAVELAAPAARG
jgi:pimeloyl-ACP methyl ester carboxylesterase